MMTQFARWIYTHCHRLVIVALLTVMLSACTVYPNGASQSIDYIPLANCCGILIGEPTVRPQFILNDFFSITMLTDDRIIGSWSLQQDVNNIVLSKDGTATTTTPSFYTRSGQWQWASGNIIIITYLDGQYEIMRFRMIDDNLAIVQVFDQYSDGTTGFVVIRSTTSYNATKY